MRKLIGVLLVLWANILFGQSYGDYYQNAEGLKEEALKTALYNIIKGHTEFPYTSSSTDVWDILKETDRDPDNSENVIFLYSGQSNLAGTEGEEYTIGQWSREHVWAKSRGDFGTANGPGTDAHHLRPEDISVNSTRGNRSFDNCQTCEEVWDNGLFTGSYIDAIEYTFEPRDAVKGDVARMIFYMATRYEGENDEPDLELTESLPSNTDTSPYHGRLSTLIEWNREDPVDGWERNRNDIIYTQFQGNRNPYIDHPELVEYIWGNTIGAVWTSSSSSTSPLDEATNVAINATVSFVFADGIRNVDDTEITNSNVASLLTFKETDANGIDVAYTVTIDADKKVITLTPNSDLKYSQQYYASLDAVEDNNDNAIAKKEISFTTIDEDLTAPIFISSPENGDTGVNIFTNITVTFDEAIRNLDDSEITNDNVANLLILKETDVDGIDLAFTATIDANKKIITATPDANLKANQLYYASIEAVEDANNNATVSSNITFTTAEDETAPTINSSPMNGASNIAISSTITFSSDETIRNIDDSEITTANVTALLIFKETDESGADVAFTATIDLDKKVITLIPNVDLTNNQSYYAKLVSVEDINNNASAPIELIFTTMVAETNPPFWVLDFENAGAYTTSVPEFSDGSGDYFTRTNGSNLAANIVYSNKLGSYFFGAQDMDEGGVTIPQELNINDIDIAGRTLSAFTVYLAEDIADDGNFDWDDKDYVKFQYDVDNSGVFKNLLWVFNDGSQYNSQASIDANFDGIGDGANILTPEFTKITAPLIVTGSTLDIKVIFNLDSGDEDIAIDNLALVQEDPSISIDNIIPKKIRIYPNPNNGKFFVQLGDAFNKNTQIEVFNVMGKSVFKTLSSDSKTKIDLRSLKQGIYFVQIMDGKNVVTQKIIKQ